MSSRAAKKVGVGIRPRRKRFHCSTAVQPTFVVLLFWNTAHADLSDSHRKGGSRSLAHAVRFAPCGNSSTAFRDALPFAATQASPQVYPYGQSRRGWCGLHIGAWSTFSCCLRPLDLPPLDLVTQLHHRLRWRCLHITQGHLLYIVFLRHAPAER